MSHKLEVDGVQLQFGNRRILSDIYFKCETGKITGLLGRNGVGKSSLMKIVYGTLKCEKSVRIDNLSINEAFTKCFQIHYLPQFNFIPKSLFLKNIFQDFDLDYILFSNIFPEFVSKAKCKIGILSGGERRLIELYIILRSKSLFVMLDEPFTHLNPLQIEKVKELLMEEKKNKGILISDHMYQHVLDICDNLYVLTNEKLHLANDFHDIEKLGYARF
jgi:ABC-type lipopolysaccharide export system ATPase subunit